MRRTEPPRHVWVEQIMGMPISIHLRSRGADPAPGAHAAVTACFDDLRRIDRIFSTYRSDSDVSRIARGELTIADADPLVAVVEAECLGAERRTDGRFSAHWSGVFDPTGHVKGWAVEDAARRHLAPLVDAAVAVGINAGGDMQLFTAMDADWRWNVGIADPRTPGALLATLAVANGAVATSGVAERGRHIIDPRTGLPASGVCSATIVGDGLASADVWATAAVVAGFEDRSWIAGSATRTGLVVADDGRVCRWLGQTTVEVVPVAA
jgi:thiamine biosynthesis lipoprotein